MKTLDQIKGTYTYELVKQKERLSKLFEDFESGENTDVEHIRTEVLDVIKDANENKSKAEFVAKVKRFCAEQISFLVYNSILSVQGEGVI